MLDPKSDILNALYRRQHDEAVRIAASAASLTVWEAAALGRNDVLERLLEAGDQLDAVSPDGNFPLGLAAYFGHAGTVRLLLDRGADVHRPAQNSMKVQPLHAAVAARSAETITALLDSGADPNARQQVGYTPLMGAAAAGRDDLVDLLLARGADPLLMSEDGKDAASLAQDHGHAELAARLRTASAG